MRKNIVTQLTRLHGSTDDLGEDRWAIQVGNNVVMTDEPDEIEAAIVLAELLGTPLIPAYDKSKPWPKHPSWGLGGQLALYCDMGPGKGWNNPIWLWHYHSDDSSEEEKYCHDPENCTLKKIIENMTRTTKGVETAEDWDNLIKEGGVKEYVRVRYLERGKEGDAR